MKAILFYISFIFTSLLLYAIFERHDSTKYMTVSIKLGKNEVYEGDTFTYIEIIKNLSIIPIRSVRIDTILPDGLEFIVSENQGVSTISENIFVGSRRHLERVWKVRAVRRGIYNIDKVRVVSASIIGSKLYSNAVISDTTNEITVLPESISITEHFRYSGFSCDEEIPHGMLTDPILKNPPRDYTPDDPFNSINWKLTAVHNRFIVNTEQPYESRELNLLLNIQSRPFEQHELTPSSYQYTELAVTVAASLFNAVNDADMSMSLLTNAVCSSNDDESVYLKNGRYFTAFNTVSSRSGILTYLELLASVENSMTCTSREMFSKLSDLICSQTIKFNNIVVVSPFFDKSMAEIHQIFTEHHIPAVYYLVCGRNDIDVIPDNAIVYYYTYK